MKRIICLMISAFLILLLSAAAAEERIILTIGDLDDRSSNRYDGENQLGIWQDLEEKLGVEIQYVHLTPETYASAMASGDLPDIVATDNNLSAILEAGVALNVDPYLEEYVPHFLQGAARLTYDVFKQLLNDGDGFYFFPCGIGYNGIGDVYTDNEENLAALTAEITKSFPSIYAESKMDMLFCMISTDDMTRLIWYGEDAEKAIAESFPDYDGSGFMIFTPKASRKAVIVPPLTKTLENWSEAAR